MADHLALIVCSLLALAFARMTFASPKRQPAFPAIFGFGDSLTDTGNFLISQNFSADQFEDHFPYGMTFFHKPTGRFCDGRLVVDFVAERLRAPLLKPILSLRRSESGNLAFEDRFVNFAVGGATAQSVASLEKSPKVVPITQFSLDVQLKWFKHYLSGAKEVRLRESLIYFGEIGGNDYIIPFLYGEQLAEIRSSVPKVALQIKKSLQKLIEDGAKYIIVEGMMPMGCAPLFRQTLNALSKDRFGCILLINEISRNHNKQLRKVIRGVTTKYPHVSIVYFDFEKAYTHILKRPNVFGFTNTTSPCYDPPFSLRPITSFNTTKPCPHPSQYLSWDKVHLTEAMYNAITNLFFGKGLQKPHPNFLVERLL